MKSHILSTIFVAIAGFLLAFLLTNLAVPELQPYQFQVISKSETAAGNGYDYASLTQPNNEVFNYDALNPTVEVYVGDCKVTDEEGNCIEEIVQPTEDEENGGEENGGTEDETGNGNGSGENEQENG